MEEYEGFMYLDIFTACKHSIGIMMKQLKVRCNYVREI